MVFMAIGLGVALFVLSYIFGFVKNSKTSTKPYECGMALLDEAEKRVSVRYYVVLLLFLLFDIETLLLFPLVAVYKEMMGDVGYRFFVFLELFGFVTVLMIGYIYIFKKGALRWE
jgi:NADH-quinone oxidoreductase subunit A